MDKQAPPATIELLFRWLLRLAVILFGLYALYRLIFFIAIAGAPDPGLVSTFRTYLWVGLLGAAFNFGAWWHLRRRTPTLRQGFVILLIDSVFFSLYMLLALHVFHDIFTILVVPGFIALSVFAGVACSLRGSLVLVTALALELIGLFLFGRNEGMAEADSVRVFLPGVVLFLYLLTILLGFLSRKMQQAEAGLRATVTTLDAVNRQMESAQEILSRYVAPQFARKIFEGGVEDVGQHQRRKLTLFFSDIADFTVAADRLEAEALAWLLNDYLDEMVTIALAHGGTVAQITGDGMFIFYGAPEATNDTDQALRCVGMAIAMQKRMRELSAKWSAKGIDEPLRIRCGINTGVVTVGGFGAKGRREYTAIGLQTNLAARLEAACEPGQILISHATWSLVGTQIPCTEKGAISVKGYSRPISTYQVVWPEAEVRA
jgi:class 3 adenylate cyclase